ncbi:MAG: efflux RND transporter periplasmic adaptor subunit, partial [Pedobacter sp.]|nr:efflux RND transporter periplasmic adaptor subunit [Pedobacter sp.]
MKTIVFRRAAIISISTATLFMSSCGHDEKKEATAVEKTPEIKTFTLQSQKMATALQMPGELIAYQQVDLYAKVSSFVKSLKADIGTEVKKGQLLMTLEAPELTSQLAAAESRLKSQEAVYTAS